MTEITAIHLYFNHLKNNLKAALDFQARDLMIILNSDFNARNQMWYEHDINNPAGEELYNLYADLGLNQMISEPTRIASYSIANTGVRHLSKSCIDHLTTRPVAWSKNLPRRTGIVTEAKL